MFCSCLQLGFTALNACIKLNTAKIACLILCTVLNPCPALQPVNLLPSSSMNNVGKLNGTLISNDSASAMSSSGTQPIIDVENN